MNILRAPSQITILKPLLSWTKTSPCVVDWGTQKGHSRPPGAYRSTPKKIKEKKRVMDRWETKKSTGGGKNLAAQRYKPSWKNIKSKRDKGDGGCCSQQHICICWELKDQHQSFSNTFSHLKSLCNKGQIHIFILSSLIPKLVTHFKCVTSVLYFSFFTQ